jgi:uncharacterized protein with PIN domain
MLHRVTETLAREQIDIHHLYATATIGQEQYLLVVGTANMRVRWCCSTQLRPARETVARRLRSAEPTMLTVTVRVYAELNDFLPAVQRQKPVQRTCSPGTSVKDLIEGIGIPHTEVDLVLVNSVPVGFIARVQDGDRISVYPVFEAFDVTGATRVRPAPLRDLRFVLDVHLGRLAAFLRFAGFDAVYRNDFDDVALAQAAAAGRVLLTRDRELLKRRRVTRGYWLRSTDPQVQLAEVLRRFDLVGAIRPFSRCLPCNGRLESVSKADVLPELPPRTRQDHDDFYRCSDCRRIYWQGSHFQALRRRLDIAIAEAGSVGGAAPFSSPPSS